MKKNKKDEELSLALYEMKSLILDLIPPINHEHLWGNDHLRGYRSELFE